MVMRFNTTSGKYSPWDPPAACSSCERGLDGAPHEALLGTDHKRIYKCADGKIWRSHFVSCPTADQHRKPKP